MKEKEGQIQQMKTDGSWREEKPFVGNDEDSGGERDAAAAVAVVVLFALPMRGKERQTLARRETKERASTKATQREGEEDTWGRWIGGYESRWKRREEDEDEGDEEDGERASSQQDHHQDRVQDSSSTLLGPGPELELELELELDFVQSSKRMEGEA